MPRTTKTITFSLPPEMAVLIACGGDIRVDEDGGRISADPVSGGGANGVGRILGGHGHGEPVVL